MSSSRPFPAALAHGELDEVLPNIFVVRGTVLMKPPGPISFRFSRNMIVVREGERLVVINSVRLNDAGLTALDKLGKVTDVIRLAANHGMDDPFYADRYQAKVWAVKGQRYTAGLNTNATETYFDAQTEIDETTTLPIDGAKLFMIHAKPPEGMLLLSQHQGTLVAGDCFQNWATTDEYFSWFSKFMMKRMGFIKPYNIGPAWLKQTKPPKDELRAILDMKFANVLCAHGTPVLGGGVDHYRGAVDRATVSS